MSDQLLINPIDTAPERTIIVVLIQPPIPNRLPSLANTYRRGDEWVGIPVYDQQDIIGWMKVTDAYKLVSKQIQL